MRRDPIVCWRDPKADTLSVTSASDPGLRRSGADDLPRIAHDDDSLDDSISIRDEKIIYALVAGMTYAKREMMPGSTRTPIVGCPTSSSTFAFDDRKIRGVWEITSRLTSLANNRPALSDLLELYELRDDPPSKIVWICLLRSGRRTRRLTSLPRSKASSDPT